MRRFLAIAFASLSEVSYLLLFARERSLLTMPEWERLHALRDQASRLLWGLLKSMKGH